MGSSSGLGRRHFLTFSGSALAATISPFVLRPASVRAQDSKKLVVAVGGGAWERAQDVAYFEPFQQETGIEIIKVPYPDLAKYRAMVRTGNVDLDIGNTDAGTALLMADEGLLQAIDYNHFDRETLDHFILETRFEYGVSTLIYSLIMAYRTDSFAESPQSWGDFWDVGRFPGLRTLASGEHAVNGCIFEVALLADGVPADQLYPLDFDRAIASLDRIKDSVVAWWVPGAQPAQLLTDGQVDMASAWNGRIQDIKDQGAPVEISWNQGILQYDMQFAIKGCPNRENAMKFLAFSSRADRQAVFAQNIAYAPPNTKAYDYIPAERAAILPTAPGLREQQVVQDYRFWNSRDANGRGQVDVALDRWTTWIAG